MTMSDSEPAVAELPGKPVNAESRDVAEPSVAILRKLNLLPTSNALEDAGKASAAFTGTPDSVAVIEAGATALSKWWAAGLGASTLVVWGYVGKFWDTYSDVHGTLLWCAAIISAAAILSLAYVVGSDVRGRAAASVATINARASVARSVTETIGHTTAASPALAANGDSVAESSIIALPTPLLATSLVGLDTNGWLAIAARTNAEDVTDYLLVKGSVSQWTPAADVRFDV
jgi:hypothetical protein